MGKILVFNGFLLFLFNPPILTLTIFSMEVLDDP